MRFTDKTRRQRLHIPHHIRYILIYIVADKHMHVAVNTTHRIRKMAVAAQHTTNIRMHTRQIHSRYKRIAILDGKNYV